jgi:hypothetical protein
MRMSNDAAEMRASSRPITAWTTGWMRQVMCDQVKVVSAVRAGLVGTVVMGFLLRLVASRTLTPHVDEAASVLAARVVSEQFIPILPSGNVYFQGFTLSLALAPLARLGLADLDHLALLRLVSVVAGTAAIVLAWRLALYVTRNPLVALGAALLVALDPLSVQWSGHVRMYALLQLASFGLAWIWIDVMGERATNRRLALGVLLGWFAVFTHSGASLLIGSIIFIVVLTKKGNVFRDPRLGGALALLGVAPITLLALNRVLRPSRAAEASSEGVQFVGDSLIRPLQRFVDGSFSEQVSALQSQGVQLWSLSVLPVSVAMFAGAALLVEPYSLCERTKHAIWYLGFTFGATLLAFIIFTDSLAGRYLLHVYSVSCLLVPLLLLEMVRKLPSHWAPALRGGAIVASLAILLVMTMSSASRTAWLLENPVVNPDYNAAMAHAALEHEPGRPVIVALPPVAYLTLGEESVNDIYFLAGHEGSARARDYSRVTVDGRRIDYWVGVDTIVSADTLRDLLLRHPDALVVIDWHRLSAEWAYGGDIERVIRAMTVPVYHGPGGVVVMGIEPPEIGPVLQDD